MKIKQNTIMNKKFKFYKDSPVLYSKITIYNENIALLWRGKITNITSKEKRILYHTYILNNTITKSFKL